MNHPQAALTDRFLKERTYLKNVTPATLLWYRIAFKNYAASFTGDAPLPSKTALQDFVVAQRDRGIRAVTVNTYIGAMNAFCVWLHEEGRVHLAALLTLDMGLRVSETLHLRHADVDFDNLILKVFGKGQKERLVPFSPELRKRLYRFERLKEQKGIRSPFVFAGSRATRWEKRNSATSLYLMERKLGLPIFGWHRLRHTFATNYVRHGGDIVRLAMVLGHPQITTTQRYLHLLTEDLSASHQKVSILNRLG